MNELFVNVKVDREERPDVDALYMDAVQALTGRGGWPMTVFMTPDREPFYGGTYFPKEAFLQLMDAIDDVYRNKPDDVQQNVSRVDQGPGHQHATETQERRSRRRRAQRRAPEPGQGLRHRVGRVRPGAEVPDHVASRFDAARLHDHRRRRPEAHHRHHARRHVFGRHVRPRRWRLRPLLDRPRVARAPLREDAVRPGTAARHLPEGPDRARACGLAPRDRRDDRLRAHRAASPGRRLLLRRGRRLARPRRQHRRGVVHHVDTG